MSVGGWEASGQFSGHDNCVSCFNSIKMAEQNLAKLSEGEKKITFQLRRSLVNSSPKDELSMLKVPWPLTSNKNNSAMITSTKRGPFYSGLVSKVRLAGRKIKSSLQPLASLCTLVTGFARKDNSPCCFLTSIGNSTGPSRACLWERGSSVITFEKEQQFLFSGLATQDTTVFWGCLKSWNKTDSCLKQLCTHV